MTMTDIDILYWIQENCRMEALTYLMKGLTFLSDKGWFWIILSLVLMHFHKTRKIGILMLISLGVSGWITNVCLKNWIQRPRPFDFVDCLQPLIAKPTDYSFPSGHTCAAFSACLILWYAYAKKIGIWFLILATGVGLSRLYLGVHYPSDVLGGFLVAYGISKIIWHIAKKHKYIGGENNGCDRN